MILDWLNNIRFCCTEKTHDKNSLYLMQNYSEETFDINEYKQSRQNFINLMREGNIPQQCAGCSHLEEKEWEDNPKVKYIAIANETKCDCNCFYCTFSTDKEFYQQFKSYDVLPLLNTLKDNDLLEFDALLDVVGGECTMYPDNELGRIVDFAIQNYCWLQFFSSGKTYSESIAYALKRGKANLCVSVDSGTSETYKKIKGADTFDIVMDNLQKYAAESKPNKFSRGFVIPKYIIIPDVNDSQEEIRAFFDKVLNIRKCYWIKISLEYDWWAKNENETVPDKIWSLLDCIEGYKTNNKIKIEYVENAVHLWTKRMNEDKNYTGNNPCGN